jgi:hypothetical protein
MRQPVTENVKREGGIDGRVGGDGAGGGEDAWNVSRRNGSDAGCDFVAARPFARRNQQRGKYRAEENAHAGPSRPCSIV